MRKTDNAVVAMANFILLFASKEYKQKFKATVIAGMAVMKDPLLIEMVIERKKVGRPVPKGNFPAVDKL